MPNYVYIATSLDGYIADKNGQLDWLETIDNPDNDDFGFIEFIDQIDALIMGRKTFETVLSFGIDWPYPVPVYVLSNTLKEVPAELKGKVEIINGKLSEIVKELKNKGLNNLYIDGGKTIQSFLEVDLIDEMILTQIPILLGGGTRLFVESNQRLKFKLVKSVVLLNQLVKSHYRKRNN